MSTLEQTVLRCERCGEPFASGSRPVGDCLNCQLLDSLAHSGHGATPTLLPVEETGTPRAYQHYEILTREDGSRWELGRGAMGVTYKARDVNLRVPVALKVIHPRSARSIQARARFLSEARTAARLRHPNVASVFHFGTIHRDVDGGRPEEECFYAMEFVEGETLEAHLRRTGPMGAGQVVEIALQITRALIAAEKHGIIHRDLKPANLMLVAESKDAQASHGEAWVKVIDFGLAKAAGLAAVDHGQESGGPFPPAQSGFSGTPHFASPEQFAGHSVDGRADVFSLGVVMWYGLTGELPFAGRSLRDIHERQVHRALPLDQLRHVQVPAPLVELLGRLLSPEPAARPASAVVLYAQLERCRVALQPDALVPARRDRFGGPKRWMLAASVLVLLAAGGWLLVFHRAQRTSAPAPRLSAVEKSVAVLPFENFSADQDSAIFADGVQDEVLTDLAKVADLKVISRSSVMGYKDAKARNLREIGQALGVTYVVEGSVQKAGNQIRVTAQLIDARTDTHKWAEKYDRPLDDVFAIQSDIAQAIAGQLQAAISPTEQAAMTEAPTHDLEAYALYLRAKQAWNDFDDPDSTQNILNRVADLLRAATSRDPRFTRAFVFAAHVQAVAYRDYETTEAQAAVVRNLAEAVARQQSGSSDADVAAGVYMDYVRHDYAQARERYAAAVRLAPNDTDTWVLLAVTEARLGLWAEAFTHLRKAGELDPNNADAPFRQYYFLCALRRYPEALAVVDRWIVRQPSNSHRLKSGLLLDWKADPALARAELALVPASYDPDGLMTVARLSCDCCARDFAAAERALAACPLAALACDSPGTNTNLPRSYHEGLLARYQGQQAAATNALTSTRTALEIQVRTQPARVDFLMYLATVDAALGRVADALVEGRRAVAMHPAQQDAYHGPGIALGFARVLAWAGERDEAIRTLQALTAQPGGPTYGNLKLHPDWDPLRGDARFEALVASLATQIDPSPPRPQPSARFTAARKPAPLLSRRQDR